MYGILFPGSEIRFHAMFPILGDRLPTLYCPGLPYSCHEEWIYVRVEIYIYTTGACSNASESVITLSDSKAVLTVFRTHPCGRNASRLREVFFSEPAKVFAASALHEDSLLTSASSSVGRRRCIYEQGKAVGRPWCLQTAGGRPDFWASGMRTWPPMR
jgi:hypothetical protein